VVILDRKLKAIPARIADAVAATGTSLTQIVGVGPITAATILGETGHVARFASNDHYGSYTGTAPIEASSGQVKRHRLSRAGNRRLNSALHMVALAHKRHDPRGSAYYAGKLAAGKGSKGATRCLKRRLSDVVYRALVDDQAARAKAGPGVQLGGTLTSSAADLIPMASNSEKPQPGLMVDHTPIPLAAS